MDAPHLILEISMGPRRGLKGVVPPGGSLKVGRTDAAGMVIPDDARLSAAHFELRWDGARATLRDLGSADGTKLDGEAIEAGAEVEVAYGAWIHAGETDLVVYVEAHTPPGDGGEGDEGDEGDDDDDDEGAPEDEEPPPFAAEEPERSPEDDAADERAAERELRVRFRQARAVERRQERRARVIRDDAAARALPILEAAAADGGLWAVLDAARSPRILQVLHEAVEDHRSLYEGAEGEALDEVAPRLVRFGPGSRLLAQLVREGWGRRWCVFAEGDAPQKDLRRHLRRFLMVEDDETGERLYFRFYDPGVLRDFWPTCSRRQREELLGPLRALLVEGPWGEVQRLTATAVP